MAVTVEQSLAFDLGQAVQLVLLAATAVAAVWAARKGSRAAEAATRQARASESAVLPALRVARLTGDASDPVFEVRNAGAGRALDVRAVLTLRWKDREARAEAGHDLLVPDDTVRVKVISPDVISVGVHGPEHERIGRSRTTVGAMIMMLEPGLLVEPGGRYENALLRFPADDAAIDLPATVEVSVRIDCLSQLGARVGDFEESWDYEASWERDVPVLDHEDDLN